MARTSRRVLSERTVSVGSRRAATTRLGSSRRRGVLISIRAMSTAVERNFPLSSTTRYFSHAPQTTSSHGSPSQRNCHSKPAAQWQTCLAFACPSGAQRSQPTPSSSQSSTRTGCGGCATASRSMRTERTKYQAPTRQEWHLLASSCSKRRFGYPTQMARSAA